MMKKRKLKTLLFVYYRGEGGVEPRSLDTYAILSDGLPFELEHRIRELARTEQCYIFCVIDSPRTLLEKPIKDGISSTSDS